MRVLDDLLQRSRVGKLAPELLLEAERILEEVRESVGGTGDSFLLGRPRWGGCEARQSRRRTSPPSSNAMRPSGPMDGPGARVRRCRRP